MNIPGSIGSSSPERTQSTKQWLVVTLTCLGVAPFALLIPVLELPFGLLAFKGYSLAILAFIAGSWWSTALVAGGISNYDRIAVLVLSNGMVLLAVCLLLAPMPAALLGLGLLFPAQALGERILPVFSGQPHYYRQLRMVVSLIACALHFVGWGLLT